MEKKPKCVDCVTKIKELLDSVQPSDDCHDFAQQVYEKGQRDALQKVLDGVLPYIGCSHGG